MRSVAVLAALLVAAPTARVTARAPAAVGRDDLGLTAMAGDFLATRGVTVVVVALEHGGYTGSQAGSTSPGRSLTKQQRKSTGLTLLSSEQLSKISTVVER